MAWVWLDKIGNYTLSKYPGKEPTPDFVGSTSLTASGLVRGNSPLDVTTGPNMNVVFNIVEGLKVTITSTSESTPRQTVSIYIQNSPLVQYTYVWGTGVNLAIGFGYDVSLQRADMYIMNANSALGKTYCNGIAHATDDYPSAETLTYAQMSILYSYLIKTLETYDWESVRSVEGKGKTYKLTKYLNINNGYPVNNVSYVNNVDVSAKSKVNNMVSDVVVDEDKVTVKYVIPAGSYSYIKLVYKRGSEPTSVSDGTAITITQASTEQIIDGIADGGTYWFVIFTDISRSNAMSIETEAVPMILWDKDLGVKHPMCSDYVSVKQNYDAYLWEFIDTYRLVGSGSNTPPGAGNTSITFQKGIKRKYATKMYIEIQCSRSYTLQWANSAMRLADTKTATGVLPSGYLRVNFVSGDSGGVTDNYTHTTPYYTLPKMLIEIDISSVGADTMWYLAFWKCNEYTEITKCYFNAPVEIES